VYDPKAILNAIQFAGYGSVIGTCGNYQHDPKCDAKNVTDYVKANCLGKNSCEVKAYPTFGDPCYGTEKRLVIQSTCSGNSGGNFSPRPNNGVFAQAIMSQKTGTLKMLLINRANAGVCVNVPNAAGNYMSVIDEYVGDNPANLEKVNTDFITLSPFAVAVIHFESTVVKPL